MSARPRSTARLRARSGNQVLSGFAAKTISSECGLMGMHDMRSLFGTALGRPGFGELIMSAHNANDGLILIQLRRCLQIPASGMSCVPVSLAIIETTAQILHAATPATVCELRA